MRKALVFLFFIPFLLFAEIEKESTYTIGFSQCTQADAWRQAMLREIKNSLLQNSNVELIVKGAGGNSDVQIAQIKELQIQGIDLLVVSPNESKPLTAIISEMYRSGIPVIVVDRKINSDDYTQYIGADNFSIGEEAGRYAANLLKGKGCIMEIWGLPGSSPAMERHSGFVAVISQYPDIYITTSTTGEWDYEKAKEAVAPFINAKAEIDLVFAHNDFMALGAYDVFIEKQVDVMPFILGVVGLYGKGAGIDAVINDKIDATFLYPSGGNQIVESALLILGGMSVEKEITLPTVAIDNKNAAALNAQMAQIVDLGERIISARKVLGEQEALYQSQGFRLKVLFCVFLFVLLLIVGVGVAYRRLSVQKKKIDKQNIELQRISTLLEEATQAKLRFFTNISHEFRTPITLIIGPLEDFLATARCSNSDQKVFNLMHRNAKRLLRLVNQLMDLRKIDNDKMKLLATQHDVVSFVREILESFEPLALQQNIDFSFDSQNEKELLWFDRDKMDKSIFNLLSNAFKFTADGGDIDVRLRSMPHHFEDGEASSIQISVSDTGVGMSEEEVKFVFDRFYQASGGSQGSFRGSGIGLALTKELITLHQGAIEVKSEKGKGTTFSIYLRKGDAHINKQQQVIDDDNYNHPKFQIETSSVISKNTDIEINTSAELPLVLIVEDNDDVRQFVRSGLEKHYRIQEAENGKVALEKIELEDPDLVISDVMMPEMDGLQLLKHLKSHRETCHIPVILLTARTSAEQKLVGLSEGADSYIPKPFNSEHLRVRVQKLIENRQQLRTYYQQTIELPSQEHGSINILDKKFLKEARLAIEANISDSDFGVEELSQVCYISRVHLYRKIKHLTGLSATEFIRHIKLKKAASMLTDSGKSSSEVAFECGFSSPSYFAKRFKEVFKMSPTEYAASHSR
ncbi:MAG: substrate-binding domain-containing protein [Bacteroidales bacterium]|jgi:signal transduction histidine kinase/DNA-binding response OmpR family regulator|nr:substrate-binding domain-containing protein [Bacteroidales bacterium]